MGCYLFLLAEPKREKPEQSNNASAFAFDQIARVHALITIEDSDESLHVKYKPVKLAMDLLY